MQGRNKRTRNEHHSSCLVNQLQPVNHISNIHDHERLSENTAWAIQLDISIPRTRSSQPTELEWTALSWRLQPEVWIDCQYGHGICLFDGNLDGLEWLCWSRVAWMGQSGRQGCEVVAGVNVARDMVVRLMWVLVWTAYDVLVGWMATVRRYQSWIQRTRPASLFRLSSSWSWSLSWCWVELSARHLTTSAIYYTIPYPTSIPSSWSMLVLPIPHISISSHPKLPNPP